MTMRKIRAELSEMRETIAAKKAATESAEVSATREKLDAMLVNCHQLFIRNPDHQPRSNIERIVSTRLTDVLEAVTQSAKNVGMRTAWQYAVHAARLCPSHAFNTASSAPDLPGRVAEIIANLVAAHRKEMEQPECSLSKLDENRRDI
jgi:hypothetical protein